MKMLKLWCIALLAILGVTGCLPVGLPPLPTPSASRTVGSSRLGFTEAWRFQTGQLPSAYAGPVIPDIFANESTVFIPYLPGPMCETAPQPAILTALALETGQLKWQNCYAGDRRVNIESGWLDTNAQKFYLITVEDFLFAYDLTTGAELWQASQFHNHTTYYFSPFASSDALEILANNSTLLKVNPQTGELMEEVPYATAHWLHYKDVEFYRDTHGVHAVNLDTQSIVWTYSAFDSPAPANNQMYFWPLQIGEDLLFLSGGPLYNLARVNLSSGQVIWEMAEFAASNFAMDETGQLYVLRGDSTLVVLDSANGQVLDEVDMGGKEIHMNNGIYWLVYQKPYILMFFGDSRELIVLKGP